MSWQAYVDEQLKGPSDNVDDYIAGIFDLSGNPWAVHPSTFTPAPHEVKRIVDAIDGKEDISINGCTLNMMKYALVRKDDPTLVLQRKKMRSEDETLPDADKWPLCAYKTKNSVVVRISKLGSNSSATNNVITGKIGDYLNMN